MHLTQDQLLVIGFCSYLVESKSFNVNLIPNENLVDGKHLFLTKGCHLR